MLNTSNEEILTIEANQAVKHSPTSTAKILKGLLAEERLLYTKLRIYYWNVTGVHFYALHKTFEAQFNDIASIRDALMEEIQQDGFAPVGAVDEFQGKTRLAEAVDDAPSAETMVATLLNDHETIIRFLSDDIHSINEASPDLLLLDLLRGFLKQHEKMAWTLRMYFYLEGKKRAKKK